MAKITTKEKQALRDALDEAIKTTKQVREPEPKVEKFNPTDWRDPKATFAPEDDGLEARMWRMARRQQDILPHDEYGG